MKNAAKDPGIIATLLKGISKAQGEEVKHYEHTF